ncbi:MULTISPECIES: SDR family oxidoreductase [unclassified Streptococcus]|uniref:SDR family oxidoreductase n=1 Tax=unclassified Streptococcus TaxID=2608887 RepID=UPI001072DCDF|nr:MULTISPECIES: SDR family oxidoreductase [unclassified Streptococcus]MBF0787442.1 SDR family oxidoreductase [Streptococcus sp. 19428wC2_LYSM12]MCQ9211733.1 SDR family oxidoreductase [Streptococcus sp. B01]MCQ9213078.1 SDR family oxidoreductase [Streptococcus sp. O1]TFV05662.1 SDR family oxidoreductase [Streptococcus sp. LYSM12]
MSDWLAIHDKVYVVTGGSSGIGLAIVKGLLKQGAKVANFDIRDSEVSHENLFFVETNVTSHQAVKEAVAKVVEHFGTVDGLVNNAGINIPSLLVDVAEEAGQYELNEEKFDKMVSINFKGLFFVSQEVARILATKKSGVIINMASEAGLEGSEGQSIYAATKGAVYSLTRSWAKELAKHGIRVLGIAPGIMEATGLRTLAYEEALAYTRGKTVEELRAGYNNTSTIPLGRSGRLNEVADLVCYYLSDRASYITGVTTNVAGGKTRG